MTARKQSKTHRGNESVGTDRSMNELQLERVEELCSSKDQYQILIESIPYGIQELDASGKITFANSARNDIFGYGEDTMIGVSILDLQVSDAAREEIKQTLANWITDQPEPASYIRRNLTRQGREIDIRVDWNYKRDRDGQVTGIISVVSDITEQKRAEKGLRSAHDRLEQRIRERTVKLLDTNRQLQNEIEERRLTEKALREQKG